MSKNDLVLSQEKWRAYKFFAKLIPRLLRCSECHRIIIVSQFRYSQLLFYDRCDGSKVSQPRTACQKCSSKDKRFLGKEFDHVRAVRTMRLAGIPITQDAIEAQQDMLRRQGKLHPLLDPYDVETNRRLGKKLFKKD